MTLRNAVALALTVAGAVSSALLAWWTTAILVGVAALAIRPPTWRLAQGSPIRRGTDAVLTLVGVGLLAASVPAAAAEAGWRSDVTANRRLTLSPQTRQMLRSLREDVSITGFFAGGSGEAAAFEDLVDQYRRESDHIDAETFDPDAEPGVARRFELRDYGTVFVDYAGRRTETNVAAEIELTSAILRVVRGERKRVCTLEGHGEGALDDASGVGFSTLAEALLTNNTEVAAVDLLRRVDELRRCDAVLAAGPTTALLPAESAALGRWLRDGGKLLAMVDPAAATSLAALVRPWGIEPAPGVLVDRAASLPEDPATLLVRRFPSANPVTRGLVQLVLPEAGGSVLSDDAGAGLTASAVATTSDSAERVVADPAVGQRLVAVEAPAAVVAAIDASRVTGVGASSRIRRTRVVWIGDSDFATNAFIDLVSNRQLVLNAVNWLLLDEDLIAIGAPPVDFRALLVTRGERDRLFYTTVVSAPAVIVLLGIAVRVLARRRDAR